MVWRWFRELSGQRSSNGFGPNAITFCEIAAWESRKRRRLKRWQEEAILAMDRAYRETVAELNDPDNKGEDLTPELLDAIAKE